MHTQRIFDTVQKIRLYDGYQGRDIIEDPREEEHFLDIMRDVELGMDPENQIRIPIRSTEELMKELGLK